MDIDRTAAIYNKVSLWIVCALSLLGLVVMQVTGRMELLVPVVVSAVFHIVCSTAYGQAWKAVARRAPEQMPRFFLAGSALRLMAAAIVLLVGCVMLRHDIEAIKWLAVVFIVYYVVVLVFDAVFFAKVSKNSNK